MEKTTKKAKAPAAKKATKKVAAAPKTAAKKAPQKAKAAAKAQRVTFTVRADAGSKVFLAGDFNNWNPTAKEMLDKKGDGLYTVVLSLTPGDYEYKYVVNGVWCADPLNKNVVQNQLGTFNSVMHVGE